MLLILTLRREFELCNAKIEEVNNKIEIDRV